MVRETLAPSSHSVTLEAVPLLTFPSVHSLPDLQASCSGDDWASHLGCPVGTADPEPLSLQPAFGALSALLLLSVLPSAHQEILLAPVTPYLESGHIFPSHPS